VSCTSCGSSNQYKCESEVDIHFPGLSNVNKRPQVANRIRKVEDGVDEFQKYLNNRGEDAKNGAASAQSSGATALRQSADSANTGTRRNQAKQTKDDLEDAMDDLNRSTNRLRRKFDSTPNYLETKVLKGITTAGRALLAALRTNIKVLARCYNLPPMGA
jgi:uncharacterized phage infection (PIP) family protein YhgE